MPDTASPTLLQPKPVALEVVTPETERVAAVVERVLDRHQPDDYRLVVKHDLIRRHSGYWWVVVVSDKTGTPVNDIVNRMSKAEQAINRKTPRWVRLSSQLPEGVR